MQKICQDNKYSTMHIYIYIIIIINLLYFLFLFFTKITHTHYIMLARAAFIWLKIEINIDLFLSGVDMFAKYDRFHSSNESPQRLDQSLQTQLARISGSALALDTDHDVHKLKWVFHCWTNIIKNERLH